MPLEPPDMAQVHRLLIVKLSAIGDVVHALPVSAALGQAFPHVELTWLVEERAAPMVLGNPFVKEVIVLPMQWRRRRFGLSTVSGFLEIARRLRKRRFDISLDLQGLSKSALLALASGARRRYCSDWPREIAPWVEQPIPRRPESLHIVDQLLDVARFLGAAVKEVMFPLAVPPEARAAADGLLRSVGVEEGQPFAVINPSDGGGGNKGWNPLRYARLASLIHSTMGLPVVLIGGREDRRIADIIVREAERPTADLVGQTDLKQAAAILLRAAVHVAGDTGTAHIAAALGTPVVCIFGRTDPVRLAPYGQEQYVVHHREQCSPICRRYHDTAPINRPQKCLDPPPRCLDKVCVEEVFEAVRRAVSERL
ncbi:MAG: glycosyltransferase family 9 protein [Chthonomonadales bacterium]